MHRTFYLNMTKNLLGVVTEYGNRLSRDVVESPSMKILRDCLDAIQCHVL